MMELPFLKALSVDCEESDLEELEKLKKAALSGYSVETKKMVTSIIDEFVFEMVSKIHMEVQTGVANVAQFNSGPNESPLNDTFSHMAQELNVIKGNQDIDCPNCNAPVKCQWLSKHLAGCMNLKQSTSYSSRNSSRIARQRIQEGFKTTSDESKNDGDDERAKPKKRNNKGKKTKANKGK